MKDTLNSPVLAKIIALRGPGVPTDHWYQRELTLRELSQAVAQANATRRANAAFHQQLSPQNTTGEALARQF